ncbi:MAG: hypothetical protein KJ749_01420 [Planctomycetes bacterium]|nr:hypothetical protein [Planctomycetota bacterium]
MKRWAYSLMVVALYGAVGAARADLASTLPSSASGSGKEIPHNIGSDFAFPKAIGENIAEGDFASKEAIAELVQRDYAVDETLAYAAVNGAPLDLPYPDEWVLREVQPLPSSTSLFFSALLSVGAWQVVRSTRYLALPALPDWYHSGGPMQVSDATPFEFEYYSTVLCLFDDPGKRLAERLIRRVPWHDARLRLTAQHLLVLADPRGPPEQSS